MNDEQIEQEIQAKGCAAPRVTIDQIEDEIVDEYYFTAEEGVEGSYGGAVLLSVSIAAGKARCPAFSLKLLTFCVLVLRNGYVVTGESACASPENFDAELGRKIARQNACAKIWPLLGFRLRDRLHTAAEHAR